MTRYRDDSLEADLAYEREYQDADYFAALEDETREARADLRREAQAEDAPAWAWVSLSEAAEKATAARRGES